MIIFDLDGTLANCEHRRHFVQDPCDSCENCYSALKIERVDSDYQCSLCKRYPAAWKKPNWKSFYEACDKDEPILPTIGIFEKYWNHISALQIQIWSGRCESVREKTIKWLDDHILTSHSKASDYFNGILRMRPIGDNTPDDRLKEGWLDDTIKEGKTIECVFDDRPKVVRMWRRRGIFVFNCNQTDKEF